MASRAEEAGSGGGSLKRVRPVLGLLAAILAGAHWATAQPAIAAKAGLISYVEGMATLDGKAVELSPAQWPQMEDRTILRSEGGRAEVLVNPCVVLHLDENSSLRMVTNRLVEARLELISGSAVVQADGTYQKSDVTIVVQQTPVVLDKTGLYRFDAEPPAVRVFGGTASVERSGTPLSVAAGWMIALTGDGAPAKFDRRKLDALDLWSKARVSVLAKISGQGSQDARNSRDLATAATQAATVNAEVRNPDTYRYDARHQPGASEFPATRGYLQDRARICAASR
jgi:hypothetical protein